MAVHPLGKLLIAAGSLLILAGLAITLLPQIPGLGRLPGDVYIKKGSFVFYFPVVTCLLVSLAVTLLLRFFKR